MSDVDNALEELRAYADLFACYEDRSGLYDPDNGDPTFDPSHFDDGLDPDHPAPEPDLFDPADFVSDYDGHVCELGNQCPYGPNMTYRDDVESPDGDPDEEDPDEPEPDDDPDDPDFGLDAARIVI